MIVRTEGTTDPAKLAPRDGEVQESGAGEFEIAASASSVSPPVETTVMRVSVDDVRVVRGRTPPPPAHRGRDRQPRPRRRAGHSPSAAVMRSEPSMLPSSVTRWRPSIVVPARFGAGAGASMTRSASSPRRWASPKEPGSRSPAWCSRLDRRDRRNPGRPPRSESRLSVHNRTSVRHRDVLLIQLEKPPREALRMAKFVFVTGGVVSSLGKESPPPRSARSSRRAGSTSGCRSSTLSQRGSGHHVAVSARRGFVTDDGG